MVLHLFRMLLIVALFSSTQLFALPSTTGTPLGGMGTSYVVFDARTGDFASGSIIPPGGGDMVSDFNNCKSSSSGFHFYVSGQGAIEKAKTTNEDAKIPIYKADFGKKGDVHFYLTAFGPHIAGDNDFNMKMSTSPLAFFEITAVNEGSASVDVAAAIEFTNKSSSMSSLIGGTSDGVVDAESGNRAIKFPDAKFGKIPSNPNNYGNAYILTGCSKDGATFSAGGKGSFTTDGKLSNSDGNLVASKCAIAGGESVKFKFVMAWWRTFVSGQDRYNVGKKDEDNYMYHNFYANSKEAATFGMENFDKVRNATVGMVDRVMASSFPEWYKDRLLNNLYPLVRNSVWTKDGRAAFWEGAYGILGTIDQAQHAAIWYMRTIPRNQWAELHYWCDDQFQREGIKGQVHHDFNIGPGLHFDPQESRFMTPWGNWDRQDYWWQPNTTDWSDLNSMLIFKAYELMLATGNKDSIKCYFPKILQTADRLYQMGNAIGKHIPIKSKSTYDSSNDEAPQYSCGVALTAYLCMVELAKFVGDEATATKFKTFYDAGRPEYKSELFNSDYGSLRNQGWAEGHVGGYAWARYFCFPPIQDKDFIEAGCTRAWNIYSQSPTLVEKLGGWHLYTYDHLGGALTGIGLADTAFKIHKLDHELFYKNLPDLVHWQSLFTAESSPGKYFCYMTAPSVWRSYVMFMGYLLDKANNRLWVRPSLPSEMNKKISNAPLPEPYGWGTLTYDETGNADKKLTQRVNIYYDEPVTIKEIVLKNNTNGTTPFVFISDNSKKLDNFTVTTEDWGMEKNIRVTFSAPISVGPSGLDIQVFSEQVGVIGGHSPTLKPVLAINTPMLSKGKPVLLSIDQPGLITVELLTLNGAKIGTLLSKKVEKAGSYSFTWNGLTTSGKTISSVAGILRVKSSGGTVSRLVYNSIR